MGGGINTGERRRWLKKVEGVWTKKKAQQFTRLRNKIGETLPLRTCLQRNVNPSVEASCCLGFPLTSVEGGPAAMQACRQQDVKSQSERSQTLS